MNKSNVIAVDFTRRADEPWPEPERFDNQELPVFPVHALAPWMREWTGAEATFCQVPVDLPACMALATTSLAVARTTHVQVRDGWKEPTNLWITLALPPGERKSAVYSDAMAPVSAYVRLVTDRGAADLAKYETDRRLLQGQVKEAEFAAIKGRPFEDGDARQKAIELNMKLRAMPEKHAPVLVTDDCTPEALAVVLAANGERMGIFSAEGGPFEMMAGRYSDLGPNIEVYLKSHPGDAHNVHRIRRDAIALEHPLLTMGLTVQPSVIRGLAAKDGFRGRGLLARFLYSRPQSALGDRTVDPPTMPTAIREAYNRALATLLVECGKQKILVMSPEADRSRSRYQQNLEPRLGPDGDLYVIGDWAGKLVGAVGRIAGVLHVSEHALDLATMPDAIPVATFERAVTIGDYFLEHARAAFGLMGADEDVEPARRVWAWRCRGGLATFTEREAMRAVAATADDLRPALAVLVEMGLIREQTRAAPSGRGRRPSPGFDVNPTA